MVSKKDRLQVRMDTELKKEVGSILDRMGLDHSTVVTMLYKSIQSERQLPFMPKVPNESTQEAIEESRSGEAEAFEDLNDTVDEDLTS